MAEVFRFGGALTPTAAISPAYITVDDGRIVDVLDSGSDVDPECRHDRSVVLPGFINAHCHLDLPLLKSPFQGFANWLSTVVAARRDRGAELTVEDLVLRAQASGANRHTVAFGDISADGRSLEAFAKVGAEGWVFREMLGRKAERWQPLLDQAISWKQKGSRGSIRPSFSPHAPYSTSWEVYRRASDHVAIDGSRPVMATHWFETAEEVRFLEHADGPIAEFLTSLSALEMSPEVRSADKWLNDLFSLRGPRWLLAHVNRLTKARIARLAAAIQDCSLAGIAHCPRTHAYFQRDPFPFRELRAAGIPVGLGTDSLASSPTLDVLDDAIFMFKQGLANERELLEMLTLDGAKSLDLEADWGSLERGRRAVVVEIPASGDPWESWRGLVSGETTVGPLLRLGGPLPCLADLNSSTV